MAAPLFYLFGTKDLNYYGKQHFIFVGFQGIHCFVFAFLLITVSSSVIVSKVIIDEPQI